MDHGSNGGEAPITSGSVLGGIWSSVIPFLELSGVWRVLLTVGIAGPILCRIAFGQRSRRFLARAVISLFLSSIFLGGAFTLVRFHTGIGYMAERFFHETDGAADLLLFGALTAFAVLLGKSAISFFLAQREETQKLVLVRVQRKEREVTVRALWDTGNLLTDPATGLAVSVGEREAFISLFSESDGVLMIPYRTVGGNGLLEGRRSQIQPGVSYRGGGGCLGRKPGPVLIGLKRGSTVHRIKLSADPAGQFSRNGQHGKERGGRNMVIRVAVPSRFQLKIISSTRREYSVCPKKRRYIISGGARCFRRRWLRRRKHRVIARLGTGGGARRQRRS